MRRGFRPESRPRKPQRSLLTEPSERRIPDAVTTHDEDAFIEAMGQELAGQGMPRMAGRVWGYLLIADPPEQSAQQIAERLTASRGAVSGAIRLLAGAGLIQRRTRRGDRREWLSAPAGALGGLMDSYLPRIQAFRRLAGEGLALVGDQPPPTGLALREVHDFYLFFEREWPTLLARYEAARGAAPVESTERTA